MLSPYMCHLCHSVILPLPCSLCFRATWLFSSLCLHVLIGFVVLQVSLWHMPVFPLSSSCLISPGLLIPNFFVSLVTCHLDPFHNLLKVDTPAPLMIESSCVTNSSCKVANVHYFCPLFYLWHNLQMTHFLEVLWMNSLLLSFMDQP